MATRILCKNAELINDGNQLKCSSTGELCAYMMWCPIAEHATNTAGSRNCKKFISK